MILYKEILASLGINLDDEKSAALIQHFEETLQERVGTEIFEALDDDQASKLITLQQGDDMKATAEFIKQNVPDYESIVKDETDILLGELADDADALAA